MTQEHVDLINDSYNSVKTSVYNELTLQTRLKPYLDEINLAVNKNGVRLSFTDLLQAFDDAIQQNSVDGLGDLIDFNRASKDLLTGTDWNGLQVFSKHMEALSQNGILDTVLGDEALFIDSDHYIATTQDEIIIGDDNDGNIFGKEGDDAIFGGARADDIDGNVGDDTLTGGNGNDTLIVTANNPGAVVGLDLNNAFFSGNENMTVTGTGLYNLTGSNVDNKLIGNASNNSIVGNAGNDLLDGGAGDDYMSGGTGDDVYMIESFGDAVVEDANEGSDTAVASFNNTGAVIGLSLDNAFFNDIENLAVRGAGLYDLYGNAGSNLLSGNGSNNFISDTAGGNDIIIWQAGDDTIILTSGTNVIAFNLGDGQDVLHFHHRLTAPSVLAVTLTIVI